MNTNLEGVSALQAIRLSPVSSHIQGKTPPQEKTGGGKKQKTQHYVNRKPEFFRAVTQTFPTLSNSLKLSRQLPRTVAPLIPEKVTGLCVSNPDAEVSPVTIRKKSEKNEAVSLTALAELPFFSETEKETL